MSQDHLRKGVVYMQELDDLIEIFTPFIVVAGLGMAATLN